MPEKDYSVVDDELKKVTNRFIAKLLNEIGNNISPLVAREIKHHTRWYENNVRDIFDNIRGNQNDEFNK